MSISELIDKLSLNGFSIFEGLSKSDLDIIEKDMETIEEKGNTILFKEGSYPKGVYLVNKGIVKIYQVNRDGENQIVDFYGSGEITGYRPMLSNETFPITAETVGDSVISFIPKSSFLEVLNRSPSFSKRLLTTLSHEFTVWVNRISIFAQQSIKENVALTLLLLEEKYGREIKNGQRVIINIPRKDLANYVGTTVETLVRILRIFKDEKIITANGRGIIILDKERLALKLGETFFA
jgi:CRP-like cAMP-binding protein